MMSPRERGKRSLWEILGCGLEEGDSWSGQEEGHKGGLATEGNRKPWKDLARSGHMLEESIDGNYSEVRKVNLGLEPWSPQAYPAYSS